MGQQIRYPKAHERRTNAHLFVHRGGDPAGVPYKCDDAVQPPVHRWRLNARPGDRCFCGATQRT